MTKRQYYDLCREMPEAWLRRCVDDPSRSMRPI